jgi:hypothetical protein
MMTGNVGMVMKIPTVLAAAAALIVGNAGQAASLESTSATTTYHSVTIDGVGISRFFCIALGGL